MRAPAYAGPSAYPGPRADRRIVWFASYPKSGNTWFRKLWRGFGGKSASEAVRAAGSLSARGVFEDVAGVSAGELSLTELHTALPQVWARAAAGSGDVWAVKAHDAYLSPLTGAPVFCAAVSRGAVYLVRNPLDVVVSFAFFSAREGAAPDFDRTIRKLNDPQRWLGEAGRVNISPQFLSDWSGHVRGWLEQDAIPVAIVRYEDMLDDTAAAFSAALARLGVDGALDAGRVGAAVEAARFEKLRAEEDEIGFQEKPEGAARFFREGRAGTWRTHLTLDQARRVVDAHGEMMVRLGYDAEI